MVSKNFVVILLLLIATTPHAASAALVQWDLENVNSYRCLNDVVCNGGLVAPTDTLTGHFVYDTSNDTITTWNITSQQFGTWRNVSPSDIAGNEPADGLVSFDSP